MKYVLMLSFLVACASAKGTLSDSAKNLEVYAAKPTGCQVQGKVVGVDTNGSTELATNDALNQAGNLHATGIFVTQEVPNGSSRAVHAIAYKCD
jgi:hypothetical protein